MLVTVVVLGPGDVMVTVVVGFVSVDVWLAVVVTVTVVVGDPPVVTVVVAVEVAVEVIV